MSQSGMKQKQIEQEARELVTGDRNEAYGSFKKNAEAVAEMTTGYLRAAGALTADQRIEARHVGPMMVIGKLARQAHGRKRDNWVDIVGYSILSDGLESGEDFSSEKELQYNPTSVSPPRD